MLNTTNNGKKIILPKSNGFVIELDELSCWRKRVIQSEENRMDLQLNWKWWSQNLNGLRLELWQPIAWDESQYWFFIVFVVFYSANISSYHSENSGLKFEVWLYYVPMLLFIFVTYAFTTIITYLWLLSNHLGDVLKKHKQSNPSDCQTHS